MQYEAKSPLEYLAMLENDWRREKLEKLREIIKSKAPNFAEDISYKMLSYSDSRGPLFYLNVQKNYVSLYVGDAKKVDPEGIMLAGVDVGKGCIRFKNQCRFPAHVSMNSSSVRLKCGNAETTLVVNTRLSMN